MISSFEFEGWLLSGKRGAVAFLTAGVVLAKLFSPAHLEPNKEVVFNKLLFLCLQLSFVATVDLLLFLLDSHLYHSHLHCFCFVSLRNSLV